MGGLFFEKGRLHSSPGATREGARAVRSAPGPYGRQPISWRGSLEGVRELPRSAGGLLTPRAPTGLAGAWSAMVAGASSMPPGEAGRAAGKEGGGGEHRPTVLVIEDEPAQRMSLALLLEDWGYTVKAAGDLPSALREVAQLDEPPSFVVSDFRLPGGFNGVEAIREIGKQAGRPVPGIILTGDTDPERLREARQSGCILMHKPVSLGSLKHAVASLAGRSAG